ncbi:MAG: nitroreductase family protein [Bacteroidota bacterium]
MEKTVSQAIAYRRSVRVFKDQPIATEKVVQCLRNATLAATSSNLQLWEFYHVTDQVMLKQLTIACLGQNAANSAQQIVVVVARKDLWRSRADANLAFLKESFKHKAPEEYGRREKMVLNYYQKLIPTLYFDILGILGRVKYILFQIIGLFRPIYRQVRHSDLRVVAHKSAGLAAQNFMIGMAAVGYDTCPMEGSDTLRIKKLLKLPRGAEINMVIGCGIRDEKGVYGPRFRVPFESVYYSV